MTLVFHHGALCDSYEHQANAQGFTFGDCAEQVEQLGEALIFVWNLGIITDKEFDKIIEKFQKKLMIKLVKPLESED